MWSEITNDSPGHCESNAVAFSVGKHYDEKIHLHKYQTSDILTAFRFLSLKTKESTVAG